MSTPNQKAMSGYWSWQSMVKRCTNPNHQTYRYYGARGIRVCERWRIFDNFRADMGPRPSRRHSIDRIDNSGNYEPGNCRWATPEEQGANMSRNRIITANGVSMSVSEWARRIGIHQSAIHHRMRRMGWSPERAVTTPKGGV